MSLNMRAGLLGSGSRASQKLVSPPLTTASPRALVAFSALPQRVLAAKRAESIKTFSLFGARNSLDPLEVKKAANNVFEFGKVFRVHSSEQIEEFAKIHKDNVVVLMCKSSHCRPCKAFMKKYSELATRFPDTCFLDIVGDESPQTRQCMINMKVKVTPTFILYKDGALIGPVTGTQNDNLLNAILDNIKLEHRGRDWRPLIDSDDDN